MPAAKIPKQLTSVARLAHSRSRESPTQRTERPTQPHHHTENSEQTRSQRDAEHQLQEHDTRSRHGAEGGRRAWPPCHQVGDPLIDPRSSSMQGRHGIAGARWAVCVCVVCGHSRAPLTPPSRVYNCVPSAYALSQPCPSRLLLFLSSLFSAPIAVSGPHC